VAVFANDDAKVGLYRVVGESSNEMCDLGELPHKGQWGVYELHLPVKRQHQGDPLLSYLFIICAEGLSVMLQKAEMNGKMEGIRVCREAPRINHLFFTDDSLVLLRDCRNDAHELR
jgi:hypothetical protein